jgi:hypothetical protein
VRPPAAVNAAFDTACRKDESRTAAGSNAPSRSTKLQPPAPKGGYPKRGVLLSSAPMESQ